VAQIKRLNTSVADWLQVSKPHMEETERGGRGREKEKGERVGGG